MSDPLRKGGAPYCLLYFILFLQALLTPAQSVVALLRGELALAPPTQQWRAGDVPLVGGLKCSLSHAVALCAGEEDSAL